MKQHSDSTLFQEEQYYDSWLEAAKENKQHEEK